MGPVERIESEQYQCDNCDQLALYEIPGGHDGKRKFRYCSRCAKGSPPVEEGTNHD